MQYKWILGSTWRHSIRRSPPVLVPFFLSISGKSKVYIEQLTVEARPDTVSTGGAPFFLVCAEDVAGLIAGTLGALGAGCYLN